MLCGREETLTAWLAYAGRLTVTLASIATVAVTQRKIEARFLDILHAVDAANDFLAKVIGRRRT